MSPALKVAVVGHTNTGKTSLLRTLTRDARFGEVSGRPGTTRHVEVARLLVDGRVLLELFDTPGIEDAIDLLALLDTRIADADQRLGARAHGPDIIRRFLETAEARGRFEQEAKVLRQMLQSHAALYVIDVRDPVLAKHRDELATLGMCGVPLLPLFNFVADGHNNAAAWREMLAGLGLHAIVSFDTIAPPQDGERTLYSKLATVLDSHRATLDALISSHEQDTRNRRMAAMQLIATMLIQVAALRQRASTADEAALQQGIKQLNTRVRTFEQSCVEHLLSLYRFYPDDIETAALPLVDGRWQEDLFDPYTLQAMGIKLGGGAAAGAAAGVGIDLMVGGMTLGAAAATGALIGGGLQTLRHFGSDLLGRLTGEKNLRVDDSILNALATRQAALVLALEQRGHAAQQKWSLHADTTMVGTGAALFADGKLPEPLRQARAQPHWANSEGPADAAHEHAIARLAQHLNDLVKHS